MTVPIAVHIRIRIPPSACNALSAASLLNGNRMSKQMLIATNAHDKTKYGPKNLCLLYLDEKRKGFIFRTSKGGLKNNEIGISVEQIHGLVPLDPNKTSKSLETIYVEKISGAF